MASVDLDLPSEMRGCFASRGEIYVKYRLHVIGLRRVSSLILLRVSKLQLFALFRHKLDNVELSDRGRLIVNEDVNCGILPTWLRYFYVVESAKFE